MTNEDNNTVGCHCGWLGKQSELIDGPTEDLKYCPKCGAFFEAISFRDETRRKSF